ncbi:LmbE family protein [Nocardioides sp. MAH-18]|uniref:LmbE family protein n=1 Tax=Nocardioides agri TaxID=2682843 RepID=A0A6L6XNW3_9ACTN|nr:MULTISPECIES: PIG-L family deacetylase [unclassified Nocardioides]MBA2953763.1 PIG-L family deacetylase [Nocardioides sp. CGMCC 1.13656]MVQ48628.1 LmbE family protein [Nocardioides sp. MAH-18]
MTSQPGPARYTLVSFHAHPDDEALLTAGTLARAAAEGHRVVVVVATAGEAGAARADWTGDHLGDRRIRELEASAAAIGAARVEVLGYPDTGWPVPTSGEGISGPADPGGPVPFSQLDAEPLAADLAALLVEEGADVLTTYDENGGYGHPDHVQVHRVGAMAAEIAGTPVVLEATIDRALIWRAVNVLRALAWVLPMPVLPDLSTAYTARGDLTHRVDVRDYVSDKSESLRAHASQSTRARDDGARTLALILRLPRPVRRRVIGREWFRERGRQVGGDLLDDVFASLRPRPECGHA